MAAAFLIHTDSYHQLCLTTAVIRLSFLLAPAPASVLYSSVVSGGHLSAAAYVAASIVSVLPFIAGWYAMRTKNRNWMLLLQLWIMIQIVFQAWAIWYPVYNPSAADFPTFSRADGVPTPLMRIAGFPYMEFADQLPLARGFFANSMSVLRGWAGDVAPDTGHLMYFTMLVLLSAGYEAAKKKLDAHAREQREQAAEAAKKKKREAEANENEADEEVENVSRKAGNAHKSPKSSGVRRRRD
ncbi:hypothetical protein BCR44DRAFT_302928 [Catenaria anguillulae PL171]|uniref:Uncharacterized protein n=1 Tax=Catenaria anguillulae PL171 TaxID=765915 RepID=A0A1Y2HTI2_9FUNG|nr:hypothetical protein BCR44DRAFT_302928 [Catenaria anguillulae PL171]